MLQFRQNLTHVITVAADETFLKKKSTKQERFNYFGGIYAYSVIKKLKKYILARK